jgi:protein MpaA
VYYRNRPGTPQNIALSPGDVPGSESETKALIKLILEIKPSLIVSIHGFLGCMDDPDASSIAKDIAQRSGLELVPDVGYATPGSFGSWCKEQAIPIITYELPSQEITEMKRIHIPILKDLLTGRYHKMLV